MRKLFSLLATTLFLAFAIPTFSAPALADYVTTDGLSPEQKAALEVQAAQYKKDNVVPKQNMTADRFKEYAEMGQAVGHGLVATAKELGVEVNNFADTKVGKWAMFLLAWHFVGAQLIHVFIGLVMLLVLNSIWVWAYRRYCVMSTVTKESKGFLRGGTKHVQYRNASGDQMWSMWLALAVIWIASLIVIF